MTKKALISRLKALHADYTQRQRIYDREARAVRNGEWGDPLDAGRYEGIATTSRWAAEDLAELLKEAKTV